MRERAVKQYEHIDFRGLREKRIVLRNPVNGKPFNQTEMAEAAGISQQAYSKIEKGLVVSPSEKVVENIAAAFNTTVSDLLDALPLRAENKAQSKSKIDAKQVIPKYHQPYQPKGFRYYDSLLLENADSTETLPSLRHVLGAYAVVMPSDTMEPRYRQGDVLFVNPELQPYYGDDVVLRVQFKNRTIGVIRELLNQEAVWDEQPDPKQSVGLISLKDKEKFSLKNDNKYIDYLDDHLHLSEKADWFVLNEQDLNGGAIEDNFSDADNENAIVAITADVIVGSERRRWMEQRRPLSNPTENEEQKDPSDMGEW